MGITTAQTSRVISDLETHLRTRLLNRSTRKISVTEAGERYLARCQLILSELEQAEAEARDAGVELRLAASRHLYSIACLSPAYLATMGTPTTIADLADHQCLQLDAPRLMAELNSGALVRVLPEYRLDVRNIYAIYASKQYLAAKTRTWIDFLRETLPPMLEGNPPPDTSGGNIT